MTCGIYSVDVHCVGYIYIYIYMCVCVCACVNKPVHIFEAILTWSFSLAKHMLYLLGCSSTQFRCTNGQCVSSSFRCNGRTGGCSDGSDERNCCTFLNHLTVVNFCSCWQLYLSTTCYILYSFLSKWSISMQQWYMHPLLSPL